MHPPRRRELSYRRRIRAIHEVTARESQVLVLVAGGLRNSEIGAELLIGEETVKMHVRHLLDKLGGRNRAHLVALGVQRGLLAFPRVDEG